MDEWGEKASARESLDRTRLIDHETLLSISNRSLKGFTRGCGFSSICQAIFF